MAKDLTTGSCLLVLLSLLLPPVAVLLAKGLGGHFVLSIVLTLLGWIPGVVHALVIVLT